MTKLTNQQRKALDRLDNARNPLTITEAMRDLIKRGFAVETSIHSNRLKDGAFVPVAKKSGLCLITEEGCAYIRSLNPIDVVST